MMVMMVCGGHLLERAGDDRSQICDNAGHYRCEWLCRKRLSGKYCPKQDEGAAMPLDQVRAHGVTAGESLFAGAERSGRPGCERRYGGLVDDAAGSLAKRVSQGRWRISITEAVAPIGVAPGAVVADDSDTRPVPSSSQAGSTA
jgi:hypothetical protein